MAGGMTRRRLAAGMGAFTCCLAALRAQAAALATADLALTEVADGIFVAHGPHEEASPANLGAIANAGCIVGSRGVAVIDTGGCLLWGRRLREAIARLTPLPVSHVVQTHMHPDHSYGAAAFRDDDPTYIGHAKLPDALAEHAPYYRPALTAALGGLAEGSELVPPGGLVADRLTVDLGDRPLELRAWPTAHTNNDLTVLDAVTGTLWTGDLLFVERVPALDGSLLGWQRVMAELGRLPARQAVPGHGPVLVPWPDAAAAQARYLGGLAAQTRAVIGRNGTLEEAVATVGQDERDRWLLFDDYHARNVTTAFTELEWE